MRPMRDGLPNAAILDPRYSVQCAPCTVCGGTLEPAVTSCTAPVSGVTVYRCPRCGTVETAAMRARARAAYDALTARASTGRARVCANPACGTEIPDSRRYCSRACHTAHQVAEREARVAAQRAERTCARPGCGATFVRHPKSVSNYCGRACAISHDWEQRNPPETREERAKQRRRVALKAWRMRQRAKRQEVAA